MKQHITVGQLNELSEKGRVQFRKYFWKIYERDLLIYGDYKCSELKGNYVIFSYGMIPADEERFGYKLLSIGQMIKFLDEKWDFINISRWHQEGKKYRWGITNTTHKKRWGSVELCDALWKAVKEVLDI